LLGEQSEESMPVLWALVYPQSQCARSAILFP
jgi:hypothetical protein